MKDNKCLDPFCSHHHQEMPAKGRFKWILNELLSHLPFSVLSAIAGIAIIAGLTMAEKVHQLVNIFHLFHPTHLLLSAIATTAMFRRLSYKKTSTQRSPHITSTVSLPKLKAMCGAIFVGFTGSVVLCSLSDIILPYLCGNLLGGNVDWHFCLSEHSMLVLPFVFLGILLGFWSGVYTRYSTFLSHSGHVLVSTMATLLYLIAFGMPASPSGGSDWIPYIGIIMLITIFSVLVPCCLSDIVYPMMFVRRKTPGN